MKTTIELPDDLLIAAKTQAAVLRKPLRRIIEEGLRTALRSRNPRGPAQPRRIRWTTVAGGLPPGVDLSDRASMTEWMRRTR
jgi:hypothetical protein